MGCTVTLPSGERATISDADRRQLMTRHEVMDVTGVTLRCVETWDARGLPPAQTGTKIGQRVTYDRAAMMRWLRETGRLRDDL